MEFGYRLMTAGAVFVPERQARSWHQGAPTYVSRAGEIRRRNDPMFANYIAVPGRFRPWALGRQYAVPRVSLVVPTLGRSYEATKACVDAVVASYETDLAVELCFVVENADTDLLRAQYQDDCRVHVRNDLPPTGFPSPYTVFLPEWAGLGADAIPQALAELDRHLAGVAHIVVPGVAPSDGTVVVWRTAALHRARRTTAPEPLEVIAGRQFGERWLDGEQLGVVDLRQAGLRRRPGQRPELLTVLDRLEDTTQQLRETRGKLRNVRGRYKELTERHAQLGEAYNALRRRRAVRAALKIATASVRLRRRLRRSG
jgi:glutathione S-transferase